jgi:hypothetical protein
MFDKVGVVEVGKWLLIRPGAQRCLYEVRNIGKSKSKAIPVTGLEGL